MKLKLSKDNCKPRMPKFQIGDRSMSNLKTSRTNIMIPKTKFTTSRTRLPCCPLKLRDKMLSSITEQRSLMSWSKSMLPLRLLYKNTKELKQKINVSRIIRFSWKVRLMNLRLSPINKDRISCLWELIWIALEMISHNWPKREMEPLKWSTNWKRSLRT